MSIFGHFHVSGSSSSNVKVDLRWKEQIVKHMKKCRYRHLCILLIQLSKYALYFMIPDTF